MDDASTSLFETPLELPHGLLYRPAFIGRGEERELIATIESCRYAKPAFKGTWQNGGWSIFTHRPVSLLTTTIATMTGAPTARCLPF